MRTLWKMETETMKISIEGNEYKVVENLGYQVGFRAKVVETPQGERVAVKRGGVWTWWSVADRSVADRLGGARAIGGGGGNKNNENIPDFV